MSLLGRAGQRALEPIWLGEALGRARALPAERAERIRSLGAAAHRRARAAGALRHDEHDVAALGLEREAALLAIAALAAAHSEHDGDLPSPARARALLEELAPKLRAAPAGIELAREVLLADDALSLDALTPARARAARASSVKLLSWLLGNVEVRAPRELRWARVLRVAAAVLVALGALPLGVWWILKPPNLALHHPVAISAQRPGSGAPAALTDGVIREQRPVLTLDQDSPWARVDLLDPSSLRSVVVHAPSNAPQPMLPLVLEISDDDSTFAEVATRAQPIDGHWRIDLDGRKARYVRLRHPGPGSLALNEIEVFGHR